MTVDWALQRLHELRDEYARGEAELLQLEDRHAQIQNVLLQTVGAMQVLQELIAASGAFDPFVEPVGVPAT